LLIRETTLYTEGAMWKKILVFSAVLSLSLLVTTELPAQDLPDIFVKLIPDPPDTVELYDPFKVEVNVWNVEDTTVVVRAADGFFDPSLGFWVQRSIEIELTAGRDTTYQGIGSPHEATVLGTWYFRATLTFPEGGIIDRDFEDLVRC
jgi:hypothetical protein